MSTQAGSAVWTEAGGKLILGPLIKSGGAGSVYRVAGQPRQVAKIYHPGIGDAHYERKLVAMLALAPDLPDIRDGGSEHVQLAWPQALLRDARGGFLGFLMPSVDVAATSELEAVMQERQARAHGLPTGLGAKLTLAANLAAVIAALHEEGHHVVDLKPVNLRFYPRSLYMAMLDCDGFSIQGQGERFHAPQFTPDYLAPEFQRTGITDAGEQGQDQFALAVVVFQLLNFGIHPYTGRPTSERVPTDIPGRIAHGAYAYGQRPNRAITPSPVSGHEAMPGPLRHLFDQAFDGDTLRPSAAQWASSLRGYALRSSLRLVSCGRDAAHQHFAGLPCAACARADLLTRTARAAPKVRQAAATQQAAVAVAAGRKPAPPRRATAVPANRGWGIAKPPLPANVASYPTPPPSPPPSPPPPSLPPTLLSPATRQKLQRMRRMRQYRAAFGAFGNGLRQLGEIVVSVFLILFVAVLIRACDGNAPRTPRSAPPPKAAVSRAPVENAPAAIEAARERATAASSALAAGDYAAFAASMAKLERSAARRVLAADEASKREVRMLARYAAGFSGDAGRSRELDRLTRALIADMHDPEAAFASGWLLLLEGDRERANNYFTRAVAAAPDYGAAWYGLGMTTLGDAERVALLAVAETRFENDTAADFVRSRFQSQMAPLVGDSAGSFQWLVARARVMAQPASGAVVPLEVRRLAARAAPEF